MLVKILDADPDFVETLKRRTGTTTGSKAYAYAADRHHTLTSMIDDLRIQNDRLKSDLIRARSIIEAARSAAAQLLDKTSQTDLLD